MTNHVHLLLTPLEADGVSRLRQDFGREYVRYVNRTYRRSGTLWEGRFKSSLVDRTRYCLTCYRYIELNPVRAGMVRKPGCYRWSSYRRNALGEDDKLVTPHEEWMMLGSDDRSRCAAYRTLFNDPPPQSEVDQVRFSNRKGLPLGQESFKSQIETQLQVKLGSGKVGRPPKSD